MSYGAFIVAKALEIASDIPWWGWVIIWFSFAYTVLWQVAKGFRR